MTLSDPDIETFSRCQAAHRPWALHNFPLTTADQTLQGMVEELGELAGATSMEDVMDAVGDVLIYALHHANIIGVDLGQISRSERRSIAQCVATDSQLVLGMALNHAIVGLGRMSHARLKRAQNIRKDENHNATEVEGLAAVVAAMHLTALALGSTGAKALAGVWDGIVSKRDWKADATKGGGHTHLVTGDDD